MANPGTHPIRKPLKAMDGDWSKSLYADALVRNIGAVLYRDRAGIERMVRKMPALKAFKDFEYGFKARTGGEGGWAGCAG